MVNKMKGTEIEWRGKVVQLHNIDALVKKGKVTFLKSLITFYLLRQCLILSISDKYSMYSLSVLVYLAYCV